ncbi:MAG: hypothetical protein KF752_11595 [Pirellulaceae bacterium]|nr:hypothetical protein [Pirellulaceae bacterium]
MSRRFIDQQMLACTLGPALTVVAMYYVLWHRPLQQTAGRELARSNQLAAATNPRDCASARQRLEALMEQELKLTQRIEENKQQYSHFVSKRDVLRNAILGGHETAASMSEILSILERSGLKCSSVQPVSDPTSQLPDALEAVAAQSIQRHRLLEETLEIRMELNGTFLHMQSALSAIAAQSVSARIVSLEMSALDQLASKEHDNVTTHSQMGENIAVRYWNLTVALRSPKP